MSLDLQHSLASAAAYLIGLILPGLAAMLLPIPHRWYWWAPVVVFVSWLLLVLFCAFVLFPIGSAWAEAHGLEAWRYYDNNTFAPFFFVGWLPPALVVGAVLFGRSWRTILFGNFSSKPRYPQGKLSQKRSPKKI